MEIIRDRTNCILIFLSLMIIREVKAHLQILLNDVTLVIIFLQFIGQSSAADIGYLLCS